MPELPEVENFRRFFERAALHKTVAGVAVNSDKVLHNISRMKLRKALEGHRFEKTRRHGKHLLVRLDNGRWLTFHFGMTGGFGSFEKLNEDPRFDRIRFDFAEDDHLAFVDQRLFGEVGITEDADTFVQERPLGKDALDPSFSEKAFRELVSGHKGGLKSLLMNQKVIAGIGNEYSDEILFQAGIHPAARVEDLQVKQITSVYRTMKKVLETAINRGAGSADFHERLPSKFLLPHREAGTACPVCGTSIETMKFSGRTACFCPVCQPASPEPQ